jgi:AraC-like DNA-binding protein
METAAALRKSIDATSFEYWHDVVCSTILEGDCRNTSKQPFRAGISTLRPGDIWLSRVQGMGQRFVRSPRHISRASNDYFVLLMQLQGTTLHRQDGREVVLRPGDVTCNDTSRPFDLQLSDHFDQVIVHMPREIAARTLGPTRRLTSRICTQDSPVGSLLSPFLRQLVAVADQAPVTTVQQLMHICGSLVLTSLGEWSGTPLDGRRWSGHALRHRAQVFIAAHAHEHTLNATTVAQAMGISLRYLQELFRERNTTPSEYIWACRLQQSRRDLADPLLAPMSICDIAMRAGFQSLAHFSRRFRAMSGLSPREFRMSALRE